jgi:thiol peroxidase
VCETSTRNFNQKASELGDHNVLHVSADLPSVAAKSCVAKGMDNVATSLSGSFGADYGVIFRDGLLVWLLSRSPVVIDEQDKVACSE